MGSNPTPSANYLNKFKSLRRADLNGDAPAFWLANAVCKPIANLPLLNCSLGSSTSVSKLTMSAFRYEAVVAEWRSDVA